MSSFCPHCKIELEIDPSLYGHVVECPQCKEQFTPEDPSAPKKTSFLIQKKTFTTVWQAVFLNIVGVLLLVPVIVVLVIVPWEYLLKSLQVSIFILIPLPFAALCFGVAKIVESTSRTEEIIHEKNKWLFL